MSEVLTQDEISQLLEAIRLGETEPEDLKPAVPLRRCRIYDFKRPDKFTKEQIRTICMIFERFARFTSNNLSAQLRSKVHVHVASVDQLAYEEFIRCIPTPTLIAILDMNPLNGKALLEIDPAITISVLNHILGCPNGFKEPQHELTYIDEVIMSGVINTMLPNLQEAFVNIAGVKPSVLSVDTNPQFVQIVPFSEMVVLVTLETKIGNVEGMVNFCIPYNTIEPIMSKLTLQSFCSSGMEGQSTSGVSEDVLYPTSLELTIEVGKGEVSFGEALAMKAGDIFKLANKTEDHFTLKVGGVDKFKCKFTGGVYKTVRVIGESDLGWATLADLLEGRVKMDKTKMDVNSIEFPKLNLDSSSGNVSNLGILSDVSMEMSVELGRTRMLVKEILAIGEGTIIELDKLAGEPVDILVNQKMIARGEVVVIDENFGVRVTEILHQGIL